MISILTIIYTVWFEWQKRSMEPNKEPRNKPTQIWPLASEQSWYTVEKVAFSANSGTADGHMPNKNEKWIWGLRDVALVSYSSCSHRGPSFHSQHPCPFTTSCSASSRKLWHYHIAAHCVSIMISPHHALLSIPTPVDFLSLPSERPSTSTSFCLVL